MPLRRARPHRRHAAAALPGHLRPRGRRRGARGRPGRHQRRSRRPRRHVVRPVVRAVQVLPQEQGVPLRPRRDAVQHRHATDGRIAHKKGDDDGRPLRAARRLQRDPAAVGGVGRQGRRRHPVAGRRPHLLRRRHRFRLGREPRQRASRRHRRRPRCRRHRHQRHPGRPDRRRAADHRRRPGPVQARAGQAVRRHAHVRVARRGASPASAS